MIISRNSITFMQTHFNIPIVFFKPINTIPSQASWTCSQLKYLKDTIVYPSQTHLKIQIPCHFTSLHIKLISHSMNSLQTHSLTPLLMKQKCSNKASSMRKGSKEWYPTETQLEDHGYGKRSKLKSSSIKLNKSKLRINSSQKRLFNCWRATNKSSKRMFSSRKKCLPFKWSLLSCYCLQEMWMRSLAIMQITLELKHQSDPPLVPGIWFIEYKMLF